jgi:hypothetical protein
MPAISRTCRGHGPLLQKIADYQSEQNYDNHYRSSKSNANLGAFPDITFFPRPLE